MKPSTQDACLIAVLAATCTVSNYALLGLPNVSVMDLIVFVSGFCFGSRVGATVGALAWCVYGSINPYGFSLPIWISTMIGEALYGVVGGLRGKVGLNPHSSRIRSHKLVNFDVEMALWGFVLTFVYDLFTNIAFALTFGVPVFYALATGWLVPPWFGVLHEGSNLILFFFATIPLVKVVQKLKGGDKH